MNFLAELKRRNVIRMAGLYLVGAWLMTQGAGTILPMFDAPDWVARTVVVLLAIGFIPALIISIAYGALGESDKAFILLDQDIAERNSRAFSFGVNPIWDDFRNDPRFAELIKRVEMSKME